MRWFKLFTEARNDAKLRCLTPEQFQVWFNLMCFSAEQTTPGTITGYTEMLLAVEVAQGNEELLAGTIQRLIQLRIIEQSETGDLTFIHFAERQYDKPSDRPERVSERVKRHRERNKGVSNDNESPVKRLVTPCNALEERRGDTLVSPPPILPENSELDSPSQPAEPALPSAPRAFGELGDGIAAEDGDWRMLLKITKRLGFRTAAPDVREECVNAMLDLRDLRGLGLMDPTPENIEIFLSRFRAKNPGKTPYPGEVVRRWPDLMALELEAAPQSAPPPIELPETYPAKYRDEAEQLAREKPEDYRNWADQWKKLSPEALKLAIFRMDHGEQPKSAIDIH